MADDNAVFGRFGKLGLVVPANNAVIEPEFWSCLPPGVAAYATRVRAKGDLTPAAVHLMEADVDQAVEAIASTGVDAVAYCDMVTSFIMAPDWNDRAVERLGQLAGCPVITAWTALRDALAHIGARRIALGTPYPRAIHALAPPFFAASGIEVATHATLDIVAMRAVPRVQPAALQAFVDGIDTTGCDALVLLATDLPTFASIPALEAATGVPVLTSNQVLLWRLLRPLAARPTQPLGRLYRD